MNNNLIDQAKSLDPQTALSIPEAAYLLDVTEAAIRRLIGAGTLPTDLTASDIVAYDAAHPNRLARRMTRKKLKYFVWLTDDEADRLEAAGFKVVNPRELDQQRRAANKQAAIVGIARKAGRNA